MAPPPATASGRAAAQPINGKEIYLRLLRQVWPYRGMFVFALLAMIVLGVTEPALAAILKPTFDGSFVEKDLDKVLTMSVLMVLLFASRGTSGYLSALALAVVSSRLIRDLREQMFANLVNLPSSTHDQSTAGVLIAKFTYDTTQVTEAATQAITILIRDTVMVLGLLAIMLYYNWQLTLVAMTTAPLVILVVKVFSQRLRAMSQELQRLMGQLTHVVQEAIDGQTVVRSFNAQDHERQRFSAVANRVRQYQLKFMSSASIIAPIAQFITAIGLATMVYLAARESAVNNMTVGTFASFFAAMGMIFAPLKRLTNVNAKLQRGIAGAASVFAFIDEPVEPDNGRRTLDRARGHLEIRHLSFDYAGSDTRALRDIHLKIPAGETFALVGPSGSGKSTLAKLIPRFYLPAHGQILIDDIDINELKLDNLRAQISLVSQEVMLFDGTVRDNIAYGPLAGCSDEALWAAIDAAYAREFIESLPQGLDTPIGQKGVRLSGGQRQRLAIARAFLKDAPILILDEATSALDTRTEREIHTALRALSQNRTTLIIAHRLSTIEDAGRIAVMDAGRIIDIGHHQELLSRGGLYTSLYQHQFDTARTPPGQAHAGA